MIHHADVDFLILDLEVDFKLVAKTHVADLNGALRGFVVAVHQHKVAVAVYHEAA